MVRAQDFISLRRVQGDIPIAFRQAIPPQTHTAEDLSAEQAAFLREDAFNMQQLLRSGKVLFGDSLSLYVQSVGEKILQKRPELQSQLSFYAVRSHIANAYASSNGIILVNIGLLARLNNEDELAFILCHEITHYLRQHPFALYQKLQLSSQSRRKNHQQTALNELLLSRNYYSQEIELEADAEGLNLFLESPYDPAAASTVFDVLERADQAVFRDKNALDLLRPTEEAFPVPPLQAVSQASEEEILVSSTHPIPAERRERIEALLSNVSQHQPSPPQRLFSNIQRLAQLDLCHLYLLQRRYEAAIHLALGLHQHRAPKHFCQYIISKALYALARHSNTGRWYDVHVDESEASLSEKPLLYTLATLTESQRHLLALWHVWTPQGRSPGMRKRAMQLIEDWWKLRVDSIWLSQDGPFPTEALAGELSDWGKDVMDRLLADPAFLRACEESREQIQLGEKKMVESERERNRKARRIARKGVNLGLNKVVFVEPFYQREDQREEKPVQFAASAEGESTYIDLLEKHARAVDLSHEILSSSRMEAEDTEPFNELALLNEWLSERLLLDDLEMVSMLYDDIALLRKKYGTDHFIWTNGLAMARKRSGRGLILTAGVIFPPLLPYSIYYLSSPDRNLYFYTMVYDVKEEAYLILYPRQIRMKDRKDVFNSLTYDLVYQLKQR